MSYLKLAKFMTFSFEEGHRLKLTKKFTAKGSRAKSTRSSLATQGGITSKTASSGSNGSKKQIQLYLGNPYLVPGIHSSLDLFLRLIFSSGKGKNGDEIMKL